MNNKTLGVGSIQKGREEIRDSTRDQISFLSVRKRADVFVIFEIIVAGFPGARGWIRGCGKATISR